MRASSGWGATAIVVCVSAACAVSSSGSAEPDAGGEGGGGKAGGGAATGGVHTGTGGSAGLGVGGAAGVVPEAGAGGSPTSDADICKPINDRSGVCINPQGPASNPEPAELDDAGARWVRIEFIDACDENSGPVSYPLYDSVVTKLTAGGIRVLMIVDYATVAGVPWGATDDASWDAFAPRFAACAGRIAAHYASPPFAPQTIAAYELWNEEDDQSNNPAYMVHVPPGAYGRMFQKAAAEMRAQIQQSAGASAELPTIMTGGLDWGSSSGYLEAMLAAVPGGIGADAIAVHCYGVRPDPDWPSPSWGFSYLGEDLTHWYESAKLPIWITEFGIEDLGIQPELVRRTYGRIEKDFASVVPHAFYYAWSDAQGDAGHPWGLLDVSGQKKPSWCAYREAAYGLSSCSDPTPTANACQ